MQQPVPTPVSFSTISQELLIGIEQRIQRRDLDRFALPSFESVTIDALVEFACLVDFCLQTGDEASIAFLQDIGRTYPLLAKISRNLRHRKADGPRVGAAVFHMQNWEWRFLAPQPPFPGLGKDDPFESERRSIELSAVHFYQRFKSALTRCGFSASIAAAITATFKEMCDNVFQHSGEHETSPAPGLAAYHVGEGWSVYSVADTGRGALESLVTNPKWAALKDESEALQAVATKKATRRTTWTEGGFQQVFKALADFNGILRLRSGNASLRIAGTDVARTGTMKSVPSMPGFSISVRCRLDPSSPEYALPLAEQL